MSEINAEPVAARSKPVVATPDDLVAVRTARGMSQIDITQRIKLLPRQVMAIEEGRWEDLPGISFARGAVRSYARLVDADVGPLLESIGGYSPLAAAPALPSGRAGVAAGTPLGADDGGRGGYPLLWVVAGLIGVVALVLYFGSGREGGGLSAWWPSGTGSSVDSLPGNSRPGVSSPGETASASAGSVAASGTPPVSAARTGSSNTAADLTLSPLDRPPAVAVAPAGPSAGTAAPAPAAVHPAPAAPTPGGAPISGAATPAAEASAAAASAVAASAAVVASAPGAGATAGGVSEPVVPGAAEAPAAGTTPAAAGSAPVAAAAAPASVDARAPVAAGKGVIVLRAAEDSWVEVRQADGRALHNGMLKAGSEIELKGTPPYRLTMGNPGQLTLTYEGVTRDLAAVTNRSNIARLTLN